MPGDLRRVVNGPDGSRYEVVGMAKDWKLGTGSVLLDAAAFLWAVVRQARGKEWVVTVRRVDTKSTFGLNASGKDSRGSGFERGGAG